MADFKIHKLKRETKGTREKQEEPQSKPGPYEASSASPRGSTQKTNAKHRERKSLTEQHEWQKWVLLRFQSEKHFITHQSDFFGLSWCIFSKTRLCGFQAQKTLHPKLVHTKDPIPR